MSKTETRARILQAAKDVFSEKGYAGSTTREISERADVREITLFRHFESKEKLFQEAIVSFSPAAILTEELDAKLSGDLSHDLDVLAHSYLLVAKGRVNYMRVGLMEAPRNPELAHLIKRIPMLLSGHLAKYLQGLHEQGKIPNANFQVIAEMFYNLLFQHVLNYYVLEAGRVMTPESEEELIRTCVGLFVKSLATAEPQS